MAIPINMPLMSDTMEEGVIQAWHKKEGDKVGNGDLLAEIETDKATMDFESPEEGTLLYIGAKEGEAIPVNSLIAVLGEPGENIDDIIKGNGGGGSAQQQEAPAPSSGGGETAAASAAPAAQVVDTSSIAATLIRMPLMSDTMEEGVVQAWHKKEGDKVSNGDLLAEIETDKATMDFESPEDGVLLHVAAKEGESVPVNSPLAVIGEEGADWQALLQAEQQPAGGGGASAPAQEAPTGNGQAAPAATASNGAAPQQGGQPASTTPEGRIKISPLARAMAEERNIDITQIQGSGEGGRIVKRDIEQAEKQQPAQAPAAAQAAAQPQAQPAPQQQAAPAAGAAKPPAGSDQGFVDYEDVKVSQMRKTIAKRLSESKFTAPHFYLTMEIRMDKAMQVRKQLNEMSPVKISFNDMTIKAVATALKQNPGVNTSWLGDAIRYYKHVNVGMAVAVDQGLLVPVIRNTDFKSLSEIAQEAKDFGAKAKNGELQPKDWEGSTFTVTNLGMFGIEDFTGIINPPDSCILAVGTIKETVVVENGEMKPGNVMKVRLSCDHRVVDGAIGAAFLQSLKELLEDPMKMLV